MNQKGMTLVELTAVMAIVGILVSERWIGIGGHSLSGESRSDGTCRRTPSGASFGDDAT